MIPRQHKHNLLTAIKIDIKRMSTLLLRQYQISEIPMPADSQTPVHVGPTTSLDFVWSVCQIWRFLRLPFLTVTTWWCPSPGEKSENLFCVAPWTNRLVHSVLKSLSHPLQYWFVLTPCTPPFQCWVVWGVRVRLLPLFQSNIEMGGTGVGGTGWGIELNKDNNNDSHLFLPGMDRCSVSSPHSNFSCPKESIYETVATNTCLRSNYHSGPSQVTVRS